MCDSDIKRETPLCNGDSYRKTDEMAYPSSLGSVASPSSFNIPDGEPIIYAITFADAQDDSYDREVSIRVNNPFQTKADTCINYRKMVGFYAYDPVCESLPGLIPDCDQEAEKIVVGYIENAGVEPFVIVF